MNNNLQIIDNMKKHRSPDYNFDFDTETGYFARWGKTLKDDPICAPGPEILDIEISSANPTDVEKGKNIQDGTVVINNRGCAGLCDFCYKGNNKSGQSVHTTLKGIKRILDKLPETVCQIAYGITDIDANPDIWKIFEETRKRGIIPNVTINGFCVTDEVAQKLAKYCGGIAVSINKKNKEVAYNTIKKLLYAGNKQVNIHIVLAEDTVDFIKNVAFDVCRDYRLEKLNALVMLSFKDKANTSCFRPITIDSYRNLINYLDNLRISYGFDSCSANVYKEAIKNKTNYKELEQYIEPCESFLMSGYCNVFGEFFACSFCEGIDDWKDGISIDNVNSLDEIWNSDRVKNWRKKLLSCNRNCPYYRIIK